MLTRRQFIRTIAAGAAGGALASSGTLSTLAATLPQISPNDSIPSIFHGKLSLEFEPFDLRQKHVFTVATMSRTSTPNVQVRIHYEGLTGYGEASMPPYLSSELGTTESVCDFLARVARGIGQFTDPMRLDDILSWVDNLDPDANAAGKAAVDIALHDLNGKIMDQPWHRVLGLNPELAPSTSYTIGIDTPDVVRQRTAETALHYNIFKVKLGRDNDRQMIETIRQVSNKPIAVDVNQGWTDRNHALDMILWLKEHGVVMVEQPLPKTRIDDIAWLSERSPLPIFADESIQRLRDIAPLKGVFTGINIKLMKCTGMREAWKMMTVARALGMKVMLGCMLETSCAISAAAQLSPGVDFADLDGNLDIKTDLFDGVKVINGRLTLPVERPGIGVVPL